MSAADRWLIHTNVISEWGRGATMSAAVAAWIARIDQSRHCVSAVTLAELRSGVEATADLRRKTRLAHWLTTLIRASFADRVIEVDEAILLEWVGMLRVGRRSGYTYPQPDGLIAATARVHGMGIVTRNVADFARAGVPLLNPWEPAPP